MNLIARFLPSLVPGLGAFLNPWVLLWLIAFGAVCFGAGVKVEGWRWDASLKDIAEANAAQIKLFYSKQAETNAIVSAGLAKDRAKLDKDRTGINRRIADAKRTGQIVTVSTPDASPGGAVLGGQGLRMADRIAVCNSRCIGLWNDGLAQGLPDAYGAWRADAEASAPSAVEADDRIDNASENFAIANRLRSQLLGWQRTACLKGWWTGPECGELK